MHRTIWGRRDVSHCGARAFRLAVTAVTVSSLAAGCAGGPDMSRRNSAEKWLNEERRTLDLRFGEFPRPVFVNRKSTFLRKVTLGALKGAAAGLLLASSAVQASTANTKDGSGEAALAVVAVFVPSSAIIGMVHGAATADPEDRLSEIGEASRYHRFADAVKEGGIGRRLASHVIALGEKRGSLVLQLTEPPSDGNAPSPVDRQPANEGVVILSIETTGLLKDPSITEGLSLYVQGRTRLDLPSYGEMEWASWRYRGDPRSAQEWLADGSLIDQEMDRAVQKLADRILSGLINETGQSPKDFAQVARVAFQAY